MHEIATDIAREQWKTQIMSGEDEVTILEALDDLYKELIHKEDGVFWLYKRTEKEIEMFEEQVKKLKAHVATMKRGQERIKGLVIDTHSAVGTLPKHSVFNPIKIRNSPGSVDVIDESSISREYFITVETQRLDKKRMLEELRAGVDIRGARLKIKKNVSGLK
jgi:hypothetical protein